MPQAPRGQQYLDFTSGIGVNSLGYCDLDWAEAVSEQAHKLQHTSNLYYTAPCGKLAKKLCKRTGMSKVFFGNSGAEANEGAIKAARKYSVDHYRKRPHHGHHAGQQLPWPHHRHPDRHRSGACSTTTSAPSTRASSTLRQAISKP
ncbi:MAG: aminotransferase class III-fold pyridoxal phosphate-dependent enzyme [Faecalibacterium prausnitzii]